MDSPTDPDSESLFEGQSLPLQENDEDFCITTLSCNDRKTLIPTIRAFLKETEMPDKWKWWILIQGCSCTYIDEIISYLKSLDNNDRFNLLISETNLGLSKGNNILIQATQNYKYILHLEDDWICLPPSITGVSKNWLTTCLQFLDQHPEVSTLFLRKYATPQEKFKFAWNRHIKYKCHKYTDNFNFSKKMEGSPIEYVNEIKFQQIPQFLFTFNPCIRRNEDYFKLGIYPLNEYNDAITKRENWTLTLPKDAPYWGWCESLTMEKLRDSITYNVAAGIFGHFEDWITKLKEQNIEV